MLRKPTLMNIKGKVKGTGDYTGHQIVLSFTVRVVINADQDQFIWRFAQERIDILNDGRFGFELPNKDQLKNGLKLEVLAPDGEVLKLKNSILIP